MQPELEILDEVPESEWQQWEVAYIEFFREQGFDLVNRTAGGQGISNPSEATREKLRLQKVGEKNPNFGKRLPSETIEKRTASWKARNAANPNSGVFRPGCCSNATTFKPGHVTVAEVLIKRSVNMSGEKNHQFGKTGELSPNFGRKFTAETRAKMSIARSLWHANKKLQKRDL